MKPDRTSMPPLHEVDPLFDGHAERPLRDLTPAERLDWIWEAMQLLRAGEASRRRPTRHR